VGDASVRVDSLVKVTGQACYTADLSLPGMLYGKALGSPYAMPESRGSVSGRLGNCPVCGPWSPGRIFPMCTGNP